METIKLANATVAKYNRPAIIETAKNIMAKHQQAAGDLAEAQPSAAYYFQNFTGQLYCLTVETKPAPGNFRTPTLPLNNALQEHRLNDALEMGVSATHHYHMQPRRNRSLVIHVQKFTDAEGMVWVLDIRIKDCGDDRVRLMASGTHEHTS